MKFAFSTVGCPTWNFETVAARAKEYGYDGVEFRAFLDDSAALAANVFLTDPDKIRHEMDAAGVAIACIAGSVAFSGNKGRDRHAAGDLRQYIDVASRLGCPLVKMFDAQVRPGQGRLAVGIAMANWLLPLADYAVEKGVSIAIENALSFRSAKEMWMVLESVPHPAIGVCWDVFNAAQVGETPYVSVPVLNNRIIYTHVKDAKFEARGAAYCKLGEGDVPVRKFITRLQGIGYEGYVTVEWDKLWLPNIAEPEEILPDAVKKLREWIRPAGPEEEAKPKHEKPAAAAAK